MTLIKTILKVILIIILAIVGLLVHLFLTLMFYILYPGTNWLHSYLTDRLWDARTKAQSIKRYSIAIRLSGKLTMALNGLIQAANSVNAFFTNTTTCIRNY